MNLEKIYPSLLTDDLAAAEDWYTRLLGRRPDHRPMPSLLHWELFDQGGLMISSSEEIASRGLIFLYIADLSAERRRLESAGITLGDDIPGDYSTLAQVRDSDGNMITLATRPSHAFIGIARRTASSLTVDQSHRRSDREDGSSKRHL
jgi:catechol 2,3-dioxygenase-like lactoylglutathione lyase family enzyme